MDSHKATEVRAQLGPLKDFSERTNVAVSAITHPAKNANAKAIDHFIGSQAFILPLRVLDMRVLRKLKRTKKGKRTKQDDSFLLMSNTVHTPRCLHSLIQ